MKRTRVSWIAFSETFSMLVQYSYAEKHESCKSHTFETCTKFNFKVENQNIYNEKDYKEGLKHSESIFEENQCLK